MAAFCRALRWRMSALRVPSGQPVHGPVADCRHIARYCNAYPLAAATAAGCAGAYIWAASVSCDRDSSSSGSSSPFVYEELVQGTTRRIQSQQQLIQYMRSMQQVIGALQLQLRTGGLGEGEAGVSAYWDRMRQLQTEVAQRSQEILYGVKDPGARAHYEETYGCARWTEPALKAIASHSPIIEIGAGAGHWQQQLSQRFGVDALAFESGKEVPLPQAGAPVGDVRPGDERMIRQYPQRTLFLCYPPADEMALKCLSQYSGHVLLYVGEGRGGVNASDGFFTTLELEWHCEQVIELDPFPECFEKLFILRRRDPTKIKT